MIKKRVKAELEKYQIFCWITQGKEIENHIPYIAIERAKANGKLIDTIRKWNPSFVIIPR